MLADEALSLRLDELMPLATVLLIGLPGGGEWVFILILVMMFFGVGKLPEVGKALGKSMRAFKEGQKAPPIDVTPSADELPAPAIEPEIGEVVGQPAEVPLAESD